MTRILMEGAIMASLGILDEQSRLKSLKDMLHQHVAPAAEELIRHEADGAVRCFACGNRCLVKPGRDGVCRVRFNDNGVLKVPFGYVGVLACDPIEKKPFFHCMPGSDALTFGMLGCDYHCGYCQNWVTSQMLRDPKAAAPPRLTNPKQLVDLAIQHGAPGDRIELQRAAHHQRMGGGGVPGSPPRAEMRVYFQWQRDGTGAWISFARTSMPTRSISRRSTRSTTASLAEFWKT